MIGPRQRVGSRLAAAAGGALIFSGGRFRPQARPPLSAASDNCLGTQHSALWPRRRVVLRRQTQIVRRYSTTPACTAQAATRRHFAIRSQRRARSARYKDGSSGGAASKYQRTEGKESRDRRQADVPAGQTDRQNCYQLATITDNTHTCLLTYYLHHRLTGLVTLVLRPQGKCCCGGRRDLE